jgi:hypothetical protein
MRTLIPALVLVTLSMGAAPRGRIEIIAEDPAPAKPPAIVVSQPREVRASTPAVQELAPLERDAMVTELGSTRAGVVEDVKPRVKTGQCGCGSDGECACFKNGYNKARAMSPTFWRSKDGRVWCNDSKGRNYQVLSPPKSPAVRPKTRTRSASVPVPAFSSVPVVQAPSSTPQTQAVPPVPSKTIPEPAVTYTVPELASPQTFAAPMATAGSCYSSGMSMTGGYSAPMMSMAPQGYFGGGSMLAMAPSYGGFGYGGGAYGMPMSAGGLNINYERRGIFGGQRRFSLSTGGLLGGGYGGGLGVGAFGCPGGVCGGLF